MITRRKAKITENGKERYIDVKKLWNLSRKYLPGGMSAEYKNKFVDEIIFRIESLEFDGIDTNGKTIEEYYFAACFAYAEENSFYQLFSEKDDGNIFEYCGSELA